MTVRWAVVGMAPEESQSRTGTPLLESSPTSLVRALVAVHSPPGRERTTAGTRERPTAGASGHLRAYASDPAVARLLARQHLDGAADQRG